MNLVARDGERVTKKLREQEEKIDWEGVNFPTPLRKTDIFENINKISVMVLGWDEEEERVGYLRIPKTKHAKAIRLFLHENHYSVITSMSELVSGDLGKHKYYFCPFCSYNHRSEESLKTHMEDCTVNELTSVFMPEEGVNVSFKNWEYTIRKPHVIYADFESRLVRIDVKKVKNTVQTQVHEPIGYCYRMVSDVDPSENVRVQYTAKTNDEDVSLHFISSVYQMTKEIGQKYAESKPMEITPREQAEYELATNCWICGSGDFGENNQKVRDHCHFTGKYRGAAHNKCNLRLKKKTRSYPFSFTTAAGMIFTCS